MKHKIAIFLLVITVFPLGIAFTWCSDNSGYQKATATKRGISFSFEYPSSYSEYVSIFGTSDSSVMFLRYLSNSQQQADREIRIDTWVKLPKIPNANALLQQHLEEVPNPSEQFTLLERSPVQVSGINGEMVVYSVIFNSPALYLSQKKCWEIYLDYKGQIFTLMLLSDIYVANEAEAEFQHLIKSFKFLE